MTEHNLFYYPYASFTNAQLPLLKMAALWFDRLVILDPVCASWDTIGADHIARDAVRELTDAGIFRECDTGGRAGKVRTALRRGHTDREQIRRVRHFAVDPVQCRYSAVHNAEAEGLASFPAGWNGDQRRLIAA